jgi:hypothetical protein
MLVPAASKVAEELNPIAGSKDVDASPGSGPFGGPGSRRTGSLNVGLGSTARLEKIARATGGDFQV